MGVVVLMGFSCAGKNWLLDEVAKRFPAESKNWDLIDTDQLLPEGKYKKLREIYFDTSMVSQGNRTPALDYIERREREVLKSLRPQRSTLIAAGPGMPTRNPEWREFIATVKPRCILLKEPPSVIETRLTKRQEEETDEHSGKPNVGAWNQDILTKYDEATDRWVLMSKEERKDKLLDLYNHNYNNVYTLTKHELYQTSSLTQKQLNKLLDSIKTSLEK